MVFIKVSYTSAGSKKDPEAYLEPSRTSAMELSRETSSQLKAINYFCKKVPS